MRADALWDDLLNGLWETVGDFAEFIGVTLQPRHANISTRTTPCSEIARVRFERCERALTTHDMMNKLHAWQRVSFNGNSHRTTSAHGSNALCKKKSLVYDMASCESSKIVFVGKRRVLCDVLQLRFSYHLRKTHHIVLTQHLARFFRDFNWRRRPAQRGFVENQQHFLSVTVMSHVCAGLYSAHVNTRIARAQRTCRSVRIRLTINFRFVSLFLRRIGQIQHE